MNRTNNIQMAKPPRNARVHQPVDNLTKVLVAIFAVLAIATAVLAFIVVRNLTLNWSLTTLPGEPEIAGGGGGPLTLDGTPLPDEPLQGAAGPTPQVWDGASRVTILMMGLDYRDWQAGEVPRSDTMILLTLDPITMTAGMLSIPRDLWVNIPWYNQYAKINTAYYVGEIYKYPGGGGPGLALETVQQTLGVPINYYAQLDFYAFARFIDEMGGLDIYIREPIIVDPLGAGNTRTLEVGVQTLDGPTALAYARQRHTAGDDFSRSARQQDVIMAIRDQVVNLNMLPTLLTRAPALYEEIKAGIRTNLSLQDAVSLALLTSKIDPANIKRAVIGPEQLQFASSPDGLAILIPIPDKIRLVRDEIFTVGGPVGPLAVASDPVQLMQAEQARVSVRNGSSQAGLANKTGEYFRSLGMNVIEETNADMLYNVSQIQILSGKPYTSLYLAQMMNLPSTNIINDYTPDSQVDIIVTLGEDWASSNPMP